MIVAVCVDNHFGMTFFGKRQSRDKKLIRDFLKTADGRRVYIRPFSAKLFEGEPVTVRDDCLAAAGKGEFCFIENADILPYAEKIEKIILYKWNRDYPYDKTFRMPDGFSLCAAAEFAGSSHENITKEEYTK